MSEGERYFEGYELKIDDFYFTGALLNAFALAHSLGIDSTFKDFCNGLVNKIVAWLCVER